MSLVHSNSHECMKSEYDLFSIPYTQTLIESSSFALYKPISTISADGPIEFNVSPSDGYLDLAHTLLGLKVKIVPKSGLRDEDEENNDFTKIGPVNFLLNSIFSQIDVYLNGKPVGTPNTHYAYRAYIETLLNYGGTAIATYLTSGIWVEDI